MFLFHIKRLTLAIALLSTLLFCNEVKATLSDEIDIERAMRAEQEGNNSEAMRLYSAIIRDSTETDYFRFYASLGLGRILKEQGNIQSAFDAFEDGMYFARRIGDDFIDGNNARFNLASLYVTYGKYEDAESLLNKGRWLAGSEGARKAIALKATILTWKGEEERAISLIDSIMPEFSADKYNRAIIIQNRGFILNNLKRHKEAEKDFTDAADLLDGKDKYVVLSNLALVQAALGNFTDAIRNIDIAISFFRSAYGDENMDLAIALRKKGEILAATKNMTDASQCFKEFFLIDKRNIIRNLPRMSVSTRLDYWTKEKPALSKIFILENSDPDFLADVALFRHHTSMLGMHDVSRLANRLEMDNKSLRKYIGSKGAAIQFIEYEDQNGDVQYAALLTPGSGRSTFIPLFGRDEIYNKDRSTPYSLYSVISSEKTEAINHLYSNQELASEVWSPILPYIPEYTEDIYFVPEGIFHLWAIENMDFPPLKGKRLHRLSSLASLPELHKGLDQDGVTLVIGGLDYSDPDPMQTECELFGCDISPTADKLPDRSAFAALTKFTGNKNKQEIFRELPATRYEADGVSSRLRNPDKRNVISEATLKRNFGVYDQVHIATHGYCLEAGLGKRPRILQDSVAADISLYYTGIALSGANHGFHLPGDDGLLSAREICDLDLSDVDLVVLSACQTAKGNITDEGVSGLVRALKMAGAGSVIASLWEVNDDSTRIFMEEFYRGMESGKTKREAFNNAREVLKNFQVTAKHRKFSPAKMSHGKEIETIVNEPYRSPFHHSPFILID